MNRALLIKTIIFAKLAGSASIGLWVLVDDHIPFSPWIVVPLCALALTSGLFLLDRSAAQRGYRRGIANAQVDPSTRLPSSAIADQVLALEFAAAERGRPLTVVLFRIENFRRLAPLDGGEAGKRILINAGAILRRRTRGMNVSARRDDAGLFISVLGGAKPRGALTFITRVTADLRTIQVGTQHLSVSVSMCEYEPGMVSADELLAAARPVSEAGRTRGTPADEAGDVQFLEI